MKNILFTTFAALMLIFIIGCRKDEVVIDTTMTPPIPIVVNYTNAEIYGRVADRTGIYLADAEVTWGSESTLTDENGFFSLNSTVKEHNAILKVSKEGFFDAIQTLQTIENVKANTTVKLTPRMLSGSFQSNDGGSIETNDNGKIDFVAGAFVDASGNAYLGEVNVFAYYLDPTIDDLKEVMPGNLTAINAENTPQLLTSYGMMNVELEDNMGNPLQISANATLTTPVPNTLQSDAPATIPLWYFDTETGTWREEGSASLQGNIYIGEVSHFTWWNCDVPQNFIYLEGQIDGGVNGTPLLTIKITEISSGQYGVMNTYNKGDFAGPVPINQTLLLEVFNSCGDLLYSEEIGPFSEDTELPIIPVDISSLNWFSFSGTLTDCDGNPITNGYVVLNAINSSVNEILTPNSQGLVSVTFANCGDGEVTYFGVDLDASQSGNNGTVFLSEDTQVGNIQACGNEFIEAFDITIAGETMTWFPCVAVLSQDNGSDLTVQITTTDEQENGSVEYTFFYIDWASNNDWEWVYGKTIFGDPAVIYDFNTGISAIPELEILSNGEVSGSLLHMLHTNVLVENTIDGTITEGCTLDMKATIQ